MKIFQEESIMMRLKAIRNTTERRKAERRREKRVEKVEENGDQYGGSKDSSMHERYQC